ncbi:MAG: cyanophycin synthetase [candidate division KSB1 bacterium]|nr:cyanophycin synthetase [candidate division KSB1 bacterium]
MLGVAKDTICTALSQFAGIQQRLERVGTVAGVKIYNDFGHHPTAVRETLIALRSKYPKQRIWALYEPRSATSRRNIFQKEWPKAFESADAVLVAPVHRPEKAPADQLFSSQTLARDIQAAGKVGEHLDIETMVVFLKKHIHKGDIIVTFSNGPFGNIHKKLLTHLK